MKQQILLLAQKSQLAELYDRYISQCIKNGDDDIIDYNSIVKEFSELLINECIKVIQDTKSSPTTPFIHHTAFDSIIQKLIENFNLDLKN